MIRYARGMRARGGIPGSSVERDRAARGESGRTPGAQKGAWRPHGTSEHRTYAPSRPRRDGRSRRWSLGSPLAAAALVAAAAAPAAARPASVGFYSEAGLGATGFLGDASGWSAVGPALDVRAGRDLWEWLSIGVHLEASSHEATVPPPPVGEYYQLYRGYADGRLGFRVGAIAVFAEGGAGLAYMSSNVLQKVRILDPGERFGFAFSAGGGAEYQLQNRHYAVGLAGGWWLIPDFASLQGIDGRLYLRYTY